MSLRTCSRCREAKPVDAFHRRKDGYQHYCKTCRAEYHHEWRQRHAERLNAKARQRTKDNPDEKRAGELRRKYGLTMEDYEQLLVSQNCVCALCKRPERARHQNGRVRHLAVDHDHATGVVRGLLCYACNVHVGYFESIGMDALAAYLERDPVLVTPDLGGQ